MPNPAGIDNNFNEWIEIYNKTYQKIYLNNWKLKNKLAEYDFGYQVIKPYSYLILRREKTNLLLQNNKGDELQLIDNQGKIVDQVSYKITAPENQSYNWCVDYDQWMWIKNSSLGKKNNCPPINTPPIAYFETSHTKINPNQTFFLSAEESYDPDGTIKKYIWEGHNKRVCATKQQNIY